MDLSPAYDAPVTRTLAGPEGNPVTITFARLDWTELKEISTRLRSAKETSIHGRADQCKLQPFEKFRALQELDTNGVRVGDIDRWALTHDGAEAITNLSAVKSNISDAEKPKIWRAITGQDRAALALELVSSANPAIVPPAQAGASPLPR